MFNSIQSVLVENISNNNLTHLSGRTENNRIVTFPGSPDMIGKFVHVKIKNVHTHSLQAELV
jgi:tRNA-2-methylthio-N6-dimethylallyladenosine synthase